MLRSLLRLCSQSAEYVPALILIEGTEEQLRTEAVRVAASLDAEADRLDSHGWSIRADWARHLAARLRHALDGVQIPLIP